MTNLEMEQRIQAMDEELAFQMPMMDIEEELEFSVIEDDESFFITEKVEKEPVKRSNPKKTENTSRKAEKSKNERTDASSDTKKEPMRTPEKTQKEEKTETATKDAPKKITYMEGSETPNIKIVPFVTETNTKEESFGKEKEYEDKSETPKETDIPSLTEEFFYEEPASHEEEKAFMGEVDKENESHEQQENFYNSRVKTTEETNVFRINIPELHFEKIAEISKQVLSAVAVLAIFFLCTSTYSYYIDKHPNVDAQTKTFVEEAAKKTENTIAYYEEQAEQQKAEVQNSSNTATASISSSNKVKLEKLMRKEQEAPSETKVTRFQSLSDLTEYINDNTILLNDILENSEKKLTAGIISTEEYDSIISQAKDKLAELSTLLTTNRAVYNQEECIEDYDILYNNINIVNETY